MKLNQKLMGRKIANDLATELDAPIFERDGLRVMYVPVDTEGRTHSYFIVGIRPNWSRASRLGTVKIDANPNTGISVTNILEEDPEVVKAAHRIYLENHYGRTEDPAYIIGAYAKDVHQILN